MLIKLLNMPFGSLAAPSLALTQLQSVLKQRFSHSVSVEIAYANIDFAKSLDDIKLYNYPHTANGFLTGIGDWFFRNAAFPDTPDNLEDYLARYFYENNPETERIRNFLNNDRQTVQAFIDQTIEKYSLMDADIVGCTALFFQTTASIAILRRLKELKPRIITAIGGACCEGVTGQELAKQIDCIDYVFSGPGLVSFPILIDNIRNNRTNACHSINGVFSKSNHNEWQIPGIQDRAIKIIGDELDINKTIDLNYDSFLKAFENAFPLDNAKPVLLLETSRGCWWGSKTPCSFCGLNGLQMHHRAMTPENALKQFEKLFRYYPRSKYFLAVDNIMPRTFVHDVFAKMTPPENATIKYEIRPDLKEEDIATLCKAGVTIVQPGIESLSTQSLKFMQKGSSAFSNISFLKKCSKHHFGLEWNLLVFSPGESESTYETYLHIIPMLTHLPPPTSAFPIMFTRHSKYFANPEQYSLKLRPQDFYRLTYPISNDSVEQLAFHFVNDNADNDCINTWLDKLNTQIQYWQKRWLNSDNLEPARLCFETDTPTSVIYDSRNGSVVEHNISETCRDLLIFLEKPASMSSIKKQFTAENEMNMLIEKGLVFEEDGQFMSLLIQDM